MRFTRCFLGPLLASAVGLSHVACEDDATRPREFENGPPTAEVVPDPVPEATPPVTRTASAAVPAAEAPDWVKKGPTFTGEDGHRYGVAKAEGIRNPSLARSTADNRARAELAKVVGTLVDVVEGDGSRKLKSSSATMSGTEIVDHWVEPGTGALYSLARQAKEAAPETTKP